MGISVFFYAIIFDWLAQSNARMIDFFPFLRCFAVSIFLFLLSRFFAIEQCYATETCIAYTVHTSLFPVHFLSFLAFRVAHIFLFVFFRAVVSFGSPARVQLDINLTNTFKENEQMIYHILMVLDRSA